MTLGGGDFNPRKFKKWGKLFGEPLCTRVFCFKGGFKGRKNRRKVRKRERGGGGNPELTSGAKLQTKHVWGKKSGSRDQLKTIRGSTKR